MNLFPIGFTKTTAGHFFGRLTNAQVKCVVDVRLNNTSQLSGFAKAKDLVFFLKSLGEIDYVHEPLLAPTKDILDAFRKHKGSWDEYEKRFLGLMDERKIDERLDPGLFDQSCLLCSEDKPHHCHRRLVADYLKGRWEIPISVKHI